MMIKDHTMWLKAGENTERGRLAAITAVQLPGIQTQKHICHKFYLYEDEEVRFKVLKAFGWVTFRFNTGLHDNVIFFPPDQFSTTAHTILNKGSQIKTSVIHYWTG